MINVNRGNPSIFKETIEKVKMRRFLASQNSKPAVTCPFSPNGYTSLHGQDKM
jgi:hypothetical protein